MGTHPVPSPFAQPSNAFEAFDAFLRHARETGEAVRGHHNQNYVVPLTREIAELVDRRPGTPVTVRFRLQDALPVVIRTWEDETGILDAIQGVLPHVPECLARGEGFTIHSYVDGVPLSSVSGNGKPVDAMLMEALVRLLAQMSQVRRGALPRLPAPWPRNDLDSQAFLHTLATLADRQIRQPNWPAFGGLFVALGVPEDALSRFGERIPAMTRRPFSLLHADLHRDNLIMSLDGDPPLICVDWELATYGDPLHDLATHLVRMQYPGHQWPEVTDAWAAAMGEIRPAAVNGLPKDLRHYIAFERAQSVYPDVMRAARSLDGGFDQKSLDAATASVRWALEAAAEPLRLGNVPDGSEIARILVRWQASRCPEKSGGRSLPPGSYGWWPDPYVPEHPSFSRSAVRDALAAEGAAPAGHVFRGAHHLNTVVSVPGVDTPVVVRRGLAQGSRDGDGLRREHATLRAIEESPVEVAAPKALALGNCRQGEPFAIHTYVGNIGQPVEHPVHGLRPQEADGLVDQLCSLTRVDYTGIGTGVAKGGFHAWLTDQLVCMVRDLPKKTQQLARVLGLPEPDRLKEILSQREVSLRTPALLHGDLGPRHLVLRDDSLAVTIVDWERAMVGDPLYDLVRHVCLTPTLQMIRDRMCSRWQKQLPSEYTANWKKDWTAYRVIELVRTAHEELDRLVNGDRPAARDLDRAVNSYQVILESAINALGLRVRPTANPFLARALA